MKISEWNGLKPVKPWKGKAIASCSNPTIMMGAELEIEGIKREPEYILGSLSGGWSYTQDNSLRGINVAGSGRQDGFAYEFISKPMEQQTLLYSMEEFFKATAFDEKNYSDRTSVHIHVNCNDLTFDQLSSVALLYQVVEDILFRFVGEGRENNIFCTPWNQCRMSHNMIAKLAYDQTGTVKRWQKYTALNLLPLLSKGTVEFRHMHGTADIKKLTTWINLLGQLFVYATKVELTELIDEIKSLNSTSEYEVFFARTLGEYLPYNDDYRAALESGIISAKYSLIDWKKDSPKKQTKAKDEVDLWVEEAMQQTRAAPTQDNRFDPWPRVGTIIDVANMNWREIQTLARQVGRYTRFDAAMNRVTAPLSNYRNIRIDLPALVEEAPLPAAPQMPQAINPINWPAPQAVERAGAGNWITNTGTRAQFGARTGRGRPLSEAARQGMDAARANARAAVAHIDDIEPDEEEDNS